MYYPDSDPIGKARMSHPQTSYVSIEDIGVIRDLPIDGDHETSQYDSVSLTKNIGAMRG